MSNSLARPKNGTKVWESRRFMIFLSLAIIALLALVGMRSIQISSIRYGELYPDPVPPQVCPGAEFSYNVQIEVKNANTVVLLTEDWCTPDTNICPKQFVSAPVYHNAKKPALVDTTATRNVPATMPPGEWELRHCNTAISDGGISSCYYVPVTVLDCSVPQSQEPGENNANPF